MRRSVESGRAVGGVRVWSLDARGEGSAETERAGCQGPEFDPGATPPKTKGEDGERKERGDCNDKNIHR